MHGNADRRPTDHEGSCGITEGVALDSLCMALAREAQESEGRGADIDCPGGDRGILAAQWQTSLCQRLNVTPPQTDEGLKEIG